MGDVMFKNLDKQKKKPMKNYMIILAIYLLTIIIVIYLCNWYQNDKEYRDMIPELQGVIPEVTEVELNHYITENEKTLLYTCIASNDICRDFEKDLKKMILKRELKDSIIYLNLQDELKAPVLLNTLKSTYKIQNNLSNYPLFILFENGKVVDTLQITNDLDLFYDETEELLDKYLLWK